MATTRIGTFTQDDFNARTKVLQQILNTKVAQIEAAQERAVRQNMQARAIKASEEQQIRALELEASKSGLKLNRKKGFGINLPFLGHIGAADTNEFVQDPNSPITQQQLARNAILEAQAKNISLDNEGTAITNKNLPTEIRRRNKLGELQIEGQELDNRKTDFEVKIQPEVHDVRLSGERESVRAKEMQNETVAEQIAAQKDFDRLLTEKEVGLKKASGLKAFTPDAIEAKKDEVRDVFEMALSQNPKLRRIDENLKFEREKRQKELERIDTINELNQSTADINKSRLGAGDFTPDDLVRGASSIVDFEAINMGEERALRIADFFIKDAKAEGGVPKPKEFADFLSRIAANDAKTEASKKVIIDTRSSSTKDEEGNDIPSPVRNDLNSFIAKSGSDKSIDDLLEGKDFSKVKKVIEGYIESIPEGRRSLELKTIGKDLFSGRGFISGKKELEKNSRESLSGNFFSDLLTLSIDVLSGDDSIKNGRELKSLLEIIKMTGMEEEIKSLEKVSPDTTDLKDALKALLGL